MNKIEQVARAIYEAWAKEKKATERTWSDIVEVVTSTTNGEFPGVHEIYKLAFLEAFAAVDAMRVPTEGVRKAVEKAEDDMGVCHGAYEHIDWDEAWPVAIDAALEGK